MSDHSSDSYFPTSEEALESLRELSDDQRRLSYVRHWLKTLKKVYDPDEKVYDPDEDESEFLTSLEDLEHKALYHTLSRQKALISDRIRHERSARTEEGQVQSERFPFHGYRAELRYLLNEVYTNWIKPSPSKPPKAEFFRRIAPCFKDWAGDIDEEAVENMLKKVGTSPSNSDEIDAMLDEAREQRYKGPEK